MHYLQCTCAMTACNNTIDFDRSGEWPQCDGVPPPLRQAAPVPR